MNSPTDLHLHSDFPVAAKAGIRGSIAIALICCGFYATMSVESSQANPLGGTVVAGSATISETGNTLQVMQDSQRAVINWGGFSIAPGEVTHFQMPNSAAAVLNRVTGGDPSAIMGTLQSNGNVFLINPNGILVGAGAQINVGGFTASTLDINNNLFMQGGELTFSGNSTASVINKGTIRALEGNIYLIGATVVNEGTLQAPNGVVGMAAGQEVRLLDSAHPHLVVKPSASSLGGTGVHNKGFIQALQAELVANGGNVYALAINNEGMIRATGSATVGGRIYLVADGGKIASSGDLIAKKGEEGGDIIAYAGGQDGSSVTLSGLVDVSGVNTGGALYVKAANIDLSGADLRLGGGVLPATVMLSTGPHTVNILQGKGGPPLNWFTETLTSVVDKDGILRITEVGADHLLHANGTTVGFVDHNNFDGFIITSADTNKPFLQDISFDLHSTGHGNPDHNKSTATFTIWTREPDGTSQPNSVTKTIAQWEAFFSATDIDPRFQAINGELIESITITSDARDATDTSLGFQFYDEVKQFKSVTAAAPTILIVQKQTYPDLSAQLFNFNVSGPAGFSANFQLSDFNIPVSEPPGTPPPFNVNLYSPPKQFAQVVLPGLYTVTETVASGWFLDGITGTPLDNTTPVFGALPALPIGPGQTGARTVTLDAGDSGMLTFHNTQGATITVDKVVTGTSDANLPFNFSVTGGPTSISTFSLSANGTPQSIYVYPGNNYTIREDIPTGWFLDSVSGANSSVVPAGPGGPGIFGTGTVLSAGLPATLTFQNTQGALINVTKVTDPVGGGPFNFSLTGGPNTYPINQSFTIGDGGVHSSGYVRPGTYTATETVPDGWYLDAINFVGAGTLLAGPTLPIGPLTPGGPIVTGAGSVELTAGQVNGTLTFQNSQAGTVVVSKTVDTGPTPQIFNFEVSGGSTAVPDFTLTHGTSRTLFLHTTANDEGYTITEVVPAGWINNEIDMVLPPGNLTNHVEPSTNVFFKAGDTIQLTYHNIPGTPAGQIIISKVTNPTGDTQEFDFAITDGLGKLFKFDVGPGTPYVFTAQNSGTYTVQELLSGGQPMDEGIGLPAWDFTSVSVNGGPALTNPLQILNITGGVTHNLAFTNTKRGEILIDKQTNLSGNPTPFNFTLNGTGVNQAFSLTGTQAPYSSGFLKPGTYTVSELTAGMPQGWRFNAMSIDGVVFNNPSATVTLNPGSTINLAYGNAYLGGLPLSESPLALFRWDPIYPDGVGRGMEVYGFESLLKHLQRAIPGEIAGDSSFHAFGPPGPRPPAPSAAP